MQTTSQILMIRPVNFGFNTETAVNNLFQKNIPGNTQQKALKEFDAFVCLLQKNGVDVTVIDDCAEPFTPDSIFPNNWLSFHEDGRVFLYPMFAVNRRSERKPHILQAITRKFFISGITDLSNYEKEQLFLEGTGSMVLDRVNRIAYACLSPRTNEKLLDEFCRVADYQPVAFTAVDAKGIGIYHTNVMMCIADSYAVICLDCISKEEDRNRVTRFLKDSGKEVVDISTAQLNAFAGNMLQVRNANDELVLVMSTQAYKSLTTGQTKALGKYNRIIHSQLNAIESAGGGSARCMMAEIFLPPK